MQDIYNTITHGFVDSPEVNIYNKYIEENENTLMIEQVIELKTCELPVDWLFQKVTEGKVDSLSPYLQRILLKHLWELHDFHKAKSYIRTIWMGTGKLTPLCFISAELILENIKEKLNEKNLKEEIKSQLLQVEKVIEEKIRDGVILINLDGQTRTQCGIVPYIQSAFNLLIKNGSPINVFDGKKHIDITPYKFKELGDITKGYFLCQNLLFNIIGQGTLEQVTESLIAINSNIKWTEWQELYHGSTISVFNKRITEVLPYDGGYMTDFFVNKMDQKTYKTEVSGWSHFVAERLAWLTHHVNPDISLLRSIYNDEKTSPEKVHSTKLCKWLDDFSQQYTSDKKVKHLWLSTYLDIRDVLDNHNKRKKPYYNQFNIPKIQILNIPKFIEWYWKKIESLTHKHVTNTESWVQDVDGKLIARPESLPVLLEQGNKYQAITDRVKLFLKKLDMDSDSLTNKRIISEHTSMPSATSVLIKSKYKTTDGKVINPLKDMKIERGHDISKAHGGDNHIDNIHAQTKESNRNYSKRNLIKE